MRPKKQDQRYKLKFRIATLEEFSEDGIDVIVAETELVPQSEMGLDSQDDEDLGTKVSEFYGEHKQKLVNMTCHAIRDLAVEVWYLSGNAKRAAKLQTVKFFVKYTEAEWHKKLLLLRARFVLKPLKAPLFQDNFVHNNILLNKKVGMLEAK